MMLWSRYSWSRFEFIFAWRPQVSYSQLVLKCIIPKRNFFFVWPPASAAPMEIYCRCFRNDQCEFAFNNFRGRNLYSYLIFWELLRQRVDWANWRNIRIKVNILDSKISGTHVRVSLHDMHIFFTDSCFIENERCSISRRFKQFRTCRIKYVWNIIICYTNLS